MGENIRRKKMSFHCHYRKISFHVISGKEKPRRKRKKKGNNICGRIIFFGGVEELRRKRRKVLDPVGSTVRFEMMKLCTGSV